MFWLRNKKIVIFNYSMAEAFIGSHTCDLEEWCNTDLDEEQDGEIIFNT